MGKLGAFRLAAAVIIWGVALVPTTALAEGNGGGTGGHRDDLICNNQAIGPTTIEGDLLVPDGAFCDLNGTHVMGDAVVARSSDPNIPTTLNLDVAARIDGDVHVERDSQFAAFGGSIVGGNVQCNKCQVADLHESTVKGNLHDNGLSQGARIRNSHIGGNLLVLNSVDTIAFGYAFSGNSIGGDFKFIENTTTAVSDISVNTIKRDLVCKDNTPAPTGGGNTAHKKQGQCALL